MVRKDQVVLEPTGHSSGLESILMRKRADGATLPSHGQGVQAHWAGVILPVEAGDQFRFLLISATPFCDFLSFKKSFQWRDHCRVHGKLGSME